MTFKKLNLKFELTDEDWIGEYNLHGSNIWDSARLLKPKMYRKINYNASVLEMENQLIIKEGEQSCAIQKNFMTKLRE